MTQNTLIVTLDGPGVEENGVFADDFARALTAVSKAMRLMVGHLGDRPQRPGRWPDWVEEQSRLKLAPIRPGSFVAELTLDDPPESWWPKRDYGEQALTALREWNGDEDSTLPLTVTDCLYDAASHLSRGTELWLGSDFRPRRVRVMPPPELQASESTTARLQGWLKTVDWDRRTAQLHEYGGGFVPLRFSLELDQDMRRLATQYVEVRGRGELNEQDTWTVVQVEELLETRSHFTPFDLDAFLNDPNPKLFDPDHMVTASEPFDVDEFIRTIYEGRRE